MNRIFTDEQAHLISFIFVVTCSIKAILWLLCDSGLWLERQLIKWETRKYKKKLKKLNYDGDNEEIKKLNEMMQNYLINALRKQNDKNL
jgi:hypothetical protein